MFIENWERQEALKRLRRNEAAKLERQRGLNAPLPVIPSLPPEPGVYEEEIHPPGEHWYKIVMPSGSVSIVHFADELWDESVFRNLERRFEAKARKRIKII